MHSDHIIDMEAVRFAIDRLRQSRAPRDKPVTLQPEVALPAQFPDTGVGEQAALEALSDLALGQSAQLHHPGYFAHMDPPTATVTWLASLWQAATNQNVLHPDVGPAARELADVLIEWVKPFFSMSGGHLVPGATVANLTALWAARDVRGVRQVITSNRAHLSIRKAAHILGLKFVEIESASNHGLVLPADLDLTDAAVVLTAGTVTTGAVDNLTQAAGAAWVHVDAAWGGPLRFSERFADVLDGVESADSVGFSAHKWCFQPKGTAVVLFKDDKAAHEALSYGGGYLSAPNIGLLGSGPATALPFLASLLAWGRAGLAERVEHGMAQASQLVELVVDDARFELWGQPTTGVVVWRPRNVDLVALRARMNQGWVAIVDVDGEAWLRCVPANLSADVRALFAQTTAALEQT